jgi:hypothetical protein
MTRPEMIAPMSDDQRFRRAAHRTELSGRDGR